MSWLDNEHCGIVQSPSIDDLEAANFAIMRINISLKLVSWLLIYLHNLLEVWGWGFGLPQAIYNHICTLVYVWWEFSMAQLYLTSGGGTPKALCGFSSLR